MLQRSFYLRGEVADTRLVADAALCVTKGVSEKWKLKRRISHQPPSLCRTCGTKVTEGYERCVYCKIAACTKALIQAAQKGRLISHSAEGETKRGESRRRHAAALRAWQSSNQPYWLNEQTYLREIQPRLASMAVPTIRKALGVSKGYATKIQSGKRLPHPRHWHSLALLVGV
jgi:hypothetical protein